MFSEMISASKKKLTRRLLTATLIAALLPRRPAADCDDYRDSPNPIGLSDSFGFSDSPVLPIV